MRQKDVKERFRGANAAKRVLQKSTRQETPARTAALRPPGRKRKRMKNRNRIKKALPAVCAAGALLLIAAFLLIGSACGLFDSALPPYDRSLPGVFFIDVGQGDAILLSSPDGGYMMIDAGSERAADALTETLDRLGVTELKYLLLTHPDEDHVGGACALFDRLTVGEVLCGTEKSDAPCWKSVLNGAKEKDLPVRTVRSGDRIDFSDRMTLEVLAPIGEIGQRNDNDRSVVVRASYGNCSFLFTGDAEKEEEDALCVRYGKTLESSVLKAGHHGSSTSSGEGFLSLVRPSVAVISCGKDNAFGHPHEEVLRRLGEAGAEQILRTDVSSTVILQTDGERVFPAETPGVTPFDRIVDRIRNLFLDVR